MSLSVVVLIVHGNKLSPTGTLTSRINHFLNITEAENKFNTVLEKYVTNDPNLAIFKTEFMAFVDKFMSFRSLRPHIVKIYRECYTLPDINGMIKFYSSPLGKKILKKESQAEIRLSQLVQEKLQEQMPQISAWFEQMLKKKISINQLNQTINAIQ